MTWTPDNGWEDGSRSVVSGETGLAHTGAVIDHEGCYFFIRLQVGYVGGAEREEDGMG